jgi:hypothetical protein
MLSICVSRHGGEPEAMGCVKQGLAAEEECNSDANENWFTRKVRWPAQGQA